MSVEKNLVGEFTAQTDLLKKLLMIELFKLGVSQTNIGKKLKLQTATVNTFLKGIKREEH
jgi:hypothetical protein